MQIAPLKQNTNSSAILELMHILKFSWSFLIQYELFLVLPRHFFYCSFAKISHAQQDPESPRGYRLVGDVCYEEVVKVASAVTPVPGGVGPMTIAMLLSNTLSSAKRMHSFN